MNAKRITLATLPQATAQEVFDQVARHLLTQKQRSTDESGACRYRGTGGLACAAGCLIADDEYIPAMENKTWGCMTGVAVPRRHAGLIDRLQIIHDSSTPCTWPACLLHVAYHQGLSPAVIEEFSARENA